MKTATTIIVLCLLSFTTFSQSLPHGYPQTSRVKLSLNQGWKFHLGDADATYYKKDTDDSKWESVNIPHTLSLTSLTLDGLDDEKTQLLFHRNVGWYRKNILVGNNPDKKVFLEFEGSHQITDVWVNGKHVGKHAIGGYTPFHFDISSYVTHGEKNQVTILTDNRRSNVIPPDPGPFDYVKFSGLYRDLYLVETDPIHITFNWESLKAGIFITTPTVDPVNKNATINIKTVVKNEYSIPQKTEVITRVIDKEGIVVLKLSQIMEIAAGNEAEFNQIGSIEDNVHLWDVDNPYLYRVNSLVLIDEKPVDCIENTLGIRKFELDPVRGFTLNNKPIKLIGFNRHQQYPYIGDAVPNSLHYKDMLQFKAFGFNCVRTAHYPQDNALIEACDELGILVYEEAPSWISMSDNKLWWQNFEAAARNMIRNHRNHPSIVMWGAGINHRGYVNSVHNVVKQEDPVRLTASQNSSWTGWQTSGITDINANMLYGPFIWDRSEPILAMEGGRGAKALAPYMRDDLMLGLMSWTAHAYYTFHPTHEKAQSNKDRTRSGGMTIFRDPRPYLQWYKSELLTKPFISIKDRWQQGTKSVTVYSNGQEVALFLNGKPIARKMPSKDSSYVGLKHPPFEFTNLTYEKGKLEAIAYNDKVEIAKTSTATAGSPYAIQLTIDTTGRKFVADGSDIIMAYAHVIDKNGVTVQDSTRLIKFNVKGSASVVGNGKAINANPMFTEYGVAPALIRAGTSAGEITVIAKSKGLKSGTATVMTIPYNADMVSSRAKPIYDFKHIKVDLGAHDQLLQFDWLPWYGQDNESSNQKFTTFDNLEATIKTASDNGVIRWLGEMNVIGKYGFVYGDGVMVVDKAGINLVLKGLPKGNYKLKTWHHAPRSNSDHMDPNKEKLKTLTIHKLPYEKLITLSSDKYLGKNNIQVNVSEGENMQYNEPGTGEIVIKSDGKTPITVNLKGNENKGIWFNAFELSEWY